MGCFSFSQNVKFKRISIDEGLSQASVNTIFQDSDGFIWIGTQDGLNRYDGYHIKVFKTDQVDKTSLSSNEINCLFEDKAGMIYIGTNDEGLSVYNKYTQVFTNYKSGAGIKKISSNSIGSILDLFENELETISLGDMGNLCGCLLLTESGHGGHGVDRESQKFGRTVLKELSLNNPLPVVLLWRL